MIKLLFLLFTIILAALASVWFVENDGSIILEWMGYRIQTSVAFAALATVMLVVLLAMSLQLLLWLKSYPKRYQKELKEKRRDKGLTALTEGFAAVAAGDPKQARKLTKKAEHNLGAIPLTRLLNAQTAQLDGNNEEARIHYTAMLENKQTEMIAVKGLLLQSRQEGDLNKAIFLADKALKVKPDANWAISILCDLYKRTKQWSLAKEMLQNAVKKKIITSESAKRELALITIVEAEELSKSGYNSEAVILAKQAFKSLPDFPPVIVGYAEILEREGKQRTAIKLLENGWKLHPHPDIATLYIQFFAEEGNDKRFVRAEKLFKLKPEHVESHLLVARMAMQADHHEKARDYLKSALKIAETYSVCRLMADLERQLGSAHEVVNGWENRAESAYSYPSWQCKNCGHQDQHWHVNCRHCDSFDSMRWSADVPSDEITASSNDRMLLA